MDATEREHELALERLGELEALDDDEGFLELRAQAATALDDAARGMKRAQAALRDALHVVRQTQAVLNGVEVETITQTDHGGHSVRSENRRAA